MSLGRVHVVLLRTRDPQNLGAAARAMKNCGITRFTLVAPETDDLVTARRVAVQAEEYLDAPKKVATLAEAVAGAGWVVGTSSRRVAGKRSLTPRQVAEEAAKRTGEIAVVFGGETFGLTNDDLLACHDLSAIPSSQAQPSFNLAQALVVYGYELFQAMGEPPKPDEEPMAVDGDLAQVERALRDSLEGSTFADPDRPRHGVRELAQTLRRARLTQAEARLWVAALRSRRMP